MHLVFLAYNCPNCLKNTKTFLIVYTKAKKTDYNLYPKGLDGEGNIGDSVKCFECKKNITIPTGAKYVAGNFG